MDIDATLDEIRQLTARALREDGLGRTDAVRLAELTDALDGWLSKGGLMPRAWFTAAERYV